MKKRTTITLIVAAIMLIVGATLVNIARGRGENVIGIFNGGSNFFVTTGTVSFGVDQKDYTVCKSGEESFSAAEVESLDVDWISGAVNVEPWDGGTVVVREQAAKPLTEGQRLRWKLEKGTLSILFCANGETKVPDKTLTVLLPRAWSGETLSISAISADASVREIMLRGDMSLDATSGGLSVTGCACSELRFESTSGDQRAESATVSGALTLHSTSGDQRVITCACAALTMDSTSGDQYAEAAAVSGEASLHSASGARDLRALGAKGILIDSTSGDTVFDGSAERLRAESTSGMVTLRFNEKPAEVSVDTNSGDVTLSFPKGTEIDLHQDTNSGRVSVRGHISYEGIPVTVETTSGDITIEEH